MREDTKILTDIIERWPDPLQAKFWRYVYSGRRSDAWRIIKHNISHNFSREFSSLMEDAENGAIHNNKRRIFSDTD